MHIHQHAVRATLRLVFTLPGSFCTLDSLFIIVLCTNLHSAGALTLPSEFCGSCTSQFYRDKPVL